MGSIVSVMSSSLRSLRAFSLRFVIAFVITATVALGALGYLNYRVSQDIAAIPRVEVKTDKSLGPGKPANYLIIGSDTRSFVNDKDAARGFGDPSSQTGQRSDTMMILHVEPQAKRTLLVSIPRDTWVNIPGIGPAKINAAFNKDLGGGPDKVVETIRSNFDIPINHYVEVDFQSFQGIVDALGSIPVYFENPARDTVTGLDIREPGCQKLSGDMALAYVRSRNYEEKVNGRWRTDPTGDIGRIQRQQDFLRRVGGEAIKGGINNPITARNLADKTLQNLSVDPSFDQNDVYRLINAFRDVDPNDTERVRTETLPADGAMRNGQSVLILKQPEADAIFAQLRSFSDSPTPAPADVKPASTRVRVVNASGQTGAAAKALDAFVANGFVSAGTGNGQVRIAKSEVLYAPGNKAKADLVASYLGGTATVREDVSLQGTDVEVQLGTGFTAVAQPTTAASAASASTGAGAVASAPPGAASAC